MLVGPIWTSTSGPGDRRVASLIALTPNDPAEHRRLARLLEKQQEFGEAEALLLRAIALSLARWAGCILNMEGCANAAMIGMGRSRRIGGRSRLGRRRDPGMLWPEP